MEPQVVETFWSRLQHSGLLNASQLATASRQLAASGVKSDAEAARHLVSAGRLTQFQADRLLDGRSRGFFFDQYKIIDLLGVGGMGWVYQAEDTATGELVALKVLQDQLKQDAGLLARFHQEARVGLRLNDPHIVRTYAVGSAGGLPYLIMEFVHGPSLLELLNRQRRLPWPQACEIARQAALGLEHAHRAGLVHRDVKPQNLLIDETGRVRLLDFGLSMIREGETGDEFSMAMIFGHECVGTAEFSAPEQADNSLTVDARADVYGLGGTLFAALTGRLPFEAKTPTAMLAAHRETPPHSVREFVPSIPQGVADIVTRMLAKDPAQRYATAGEAAAALAIWAESTPIQFNFEEILAERKKHALQRLAQMPKSRPTAPSLATSTARPGTVSSVAKPTKSSPTGFSTSGAPSASPSTLADQSPSAIPRPPVVVRRRSDKPNRDDAEAIASQAALRPLDGGEPLPLRHDRLVVGRRDDCDVQLADPTVSSRHCELQFDGEGWWIRDLESRNGVSVNGVTTKCLALELGDVVQIGSHLRFRLESTRPASGSAFFGQFIRVAALGASLLLISLLLAGLWWQLLGHH